MKIEFTPISVKRYRSSFRDLEVGDQFFEDHSTYGLRTITRITDKDFIIGYGDVKPSGLHEQQIRFDRETGRKRGSPSYRGATLPTPELLKDMNETCETNIISNALRNVRFRNLPIDTLRQIAALMP